MRSVSKLEQAKDAILANIIRAANDDTESVESVKHLVEAYSIIVSAETQEKMTIWTTGGDFEDDDLDSTGRFVGCFEGDTVPSVSDLPGTHLTVRNDVFGCIHIDIDDFYLILKLHFLFQTPAARLS